MPINLAIKDIVNQLNRECDCISLDTQLLQRNLRSSLDDIDLYQLIKETRPHLFSPTMVFLNPQYVAQMAALISVIQRLSTQTAYAQKVLSWAPAIAGVSPGNSGVFYGYDFHLDEHGPKLIEINSNAGGALLNLILMHAQRECCPDLKKLVGNTVDRENLEDKLVNMFKHEWQQAGRLTPLNCIAIIDDQPESQYLYPEFVLFQRLFEKYGIKTLIADPSSLEYRDNKLRCNNQVIDMVYNRLTDFSLNEPAHQSLLQAYTEQAIVLTPHPRGHALFADKRNLALLSDAEKLKALNVDDEMINVLSKTIAHTALVSQQQADFYWNQRKQLFFKPATGYGSKAVYRGDKVTRSVWNEIISGNYVAQQFVKPTERTVRIGDTQTSLKFDIRCYVYEGEIQLIAARLYQGQVTNFRTAGGGFAPVYY